MAVDYVAWLENGIAIDATYSGADPHRFVVGAGTVIGGLDQGVRGMRVGGTRQLQVPADLAYGSQGVQNRIPRTPHSPTRWCSAMCGSPRSNAPWWKRGPGPSGPPGIRRSRPGRRRRTGARPRGHRAHGLCDVGQRRARRHVVRASPAHSGPARIGSASARLGRRHAGNASRRAPRAPDSARPGLRRGRARRGHSTPRHNHFGAGGPSDGPPALTKRPTRPPAEITARCRRSFPRISIVE